MIAVTDFWDNGQWRCIMAKRDGYCRQFHSSPNPTISSSFRAFDVVAKPVAER